MPVEYLKDGDIKFIGLDSRDNPASLPQGVVSRSENFRLDRGVATVRKGLQRKTAFALVGQTVYGSGAYIDTTGQEILIIVVTNGLYTYNPQTEALSSKINFPVGETIVTQEGCDVVQAIDKVFITRGFSKRPLMWDMTSGAGSITALPLSPTAGYQFPNCVSLLYYANRLIANGKHNLEANTLRNYDTASISNFLDYQEWAALDAFTINNGSNDQIVGIAPWTLNEFLVFMRNSIFYISVGNGRYTTGDGLASDASLRTMVSDLGCSAKRTIVQANGGVVFLSDNGVYFLQPSQVGSNESTRLMSVADPMSAPIDDVIQRINKNYSSRSVATYWNNRYYLSVPLDSSVDNNAILVFNFILNAWESVDVYPAGFDIMNFLIAKKDNQRRMFGIDTDQGIFLMEQLNWDEYGAATSIAVLPFYIPITLPLTETFTPNAINATLVTRVYSFGASAVGEKRFSTAEVDLVADAGSQITTAINVLNPDVFETIDTFGAPTTEDSTRRNPIRKLGSGIQLQFSTNNLRPSIRSAYVYAVQKQKQNQSKK